MPAAVVDGGALAREHRPVALFEIGDFDREGRERDGVGAQVHLAVAVADGERAALPRGDHQVVVAGEDDGEREGALQVRQRAAWWPPPERGPPAFVGDEVHDHFGIGVGLELVALGDEFCFSSQKFSMMPLWTTETRVVHVRMRVALGGPAVRRPARVADAGVALAGARWTSRSSRFLSLPSARRRSRWPFSTVAMPAES